MASVAHDRQQAGDLSHRIQIEAPVRSTDALAQVTRRYYFLATM